MIDLTGKKVIISRTDSIGDVMLTLPMCTWIKQKFEGVKVVFLGKGYTRDVVEAYVDVDEFVDWNDFDQLGSNQQVEKMEELEADAIIHVFPKKEIAQLAKKAKIADRVGTSHRAFHLLTCNHRPKFTRKRSDLHEAQLNHELLRPFGLETIPSLEEIVEKTVNFKIELVDLPAEFSELQDYVILHPKSQGSAKEWPAEKYMQLAMKLVEAGKTVVFTGTQREGAQFKGLIPSSEHIVDTTGKLSLKELMVLISKAEGLVACSTGPLHIAGYLGVNTIGLYSPKRPIHPGRWSALGTKVVILVKDENCPTCLSGEACDCIKEISVSSVLSKLQ